MASANSVIPDENPSPQSRYRAESTAVVVVKFEAERLQQYKDCTDTLWCEGISTGKWSYVYLMTTSSFDECLKAFTELLYLYCKGSDL